jgi:hypothetical protein
VKDERLTGKQLFLSNKARNDEDDGESPLDFGDIADYEGLIAAEEEDDDEDYNPEDDSDDEDFDDDDYDDEDDGEES